MKKSLLLFVVLAALVAFAPMASAISLGDGLNEAGSPYRVKIEDYSNLYTPNGVAIPHAGPASFQLENEQRTIFRATTILNNANNSVFDLNSPTELTGVLYDLKLVQVVATSPTNFVLDFAPMGRNPLTADLDGDIAGLPANRVAGGVVEVYQDAAKNFSNNPGGVAPYASKLPALAPVLQDPGAAPTLWTQGAAGHAPGGPGADVFPTVTDGSLWLAAVLLDLNYMVDIGAILAPGTPYFPGTVLREEFDLSRGTGFGLGYMNIAGGAPDVMAEMERGFGGALVDLTMRFNLTTALFDPNTGTILPNIDYIGPGQWTVESEDPIRFGVIPEPATISLLGMGLAGLVGLRRRKKS